MLATMLKPSPAPSLWQDAVSATFGTVFMSDGTSKLTQKSLLVRKARTLSKQTLRPFHIPYPQPQTLLWAVRLRALLEASVAILAGST